jgi:hypothetical protein
VYWLISFVLALIILRILHWFFSDIDRVAVVVSCFLVSIILYFLTFYVHALITVK